MRARWMNPAASNWQVGTASGAFIEMRSSQSGVRRCLSNRLAIGFIEDSPRRGTATWAGLCGLECAAGPMAMVLVEVNSCVIRQCQIKPKETSEELCVVCTGILLTQY